MYKDVSTRHHWPFKKALAVFSLILAQQFLARVHKHKTVKFDEVGERTATKQLNKLKRVENFIQLTSQPIFSEASRRNGANRLIFQPKFSVFSCIW